MILDIIVLTDAMANLKHWEYITELIWIANIAQCSIQKAILFDTNSFIIHTKRKELSIFGRKKIKANLQIIGHTLTSSIKAKLIIGTIGAKITITINMHHRACRRYSFSDVLRMNNTNE